MCRILAGRRVMLTRGKAEAAPLRQKLERLGATVVELPTVVIEPVDDLDALDEVLGHLSAFDWIAFTSRNAVRAVFTRLAALELPQSLPTTIRVGAVGPATARQLEAHAVRVDAVPGEATAAALASRLAEIGIRGSHIMVPVGNLARPELRLGLERAGAQVQEVVVYRTVKPEVIDSEPFEALRRGEVDVVALASPSAVTNLAAMLGADAESLARTRLACIGPTTAQAVRELGLEPAVVAEDHSLDGLAVAIEQLFGTERVGAV